MSHSSRTLLSALSGRFWNECQEKPYTPHHPKRCQHLPDAPLPTSLSKVQACADGAQTASGAFFLPMTGKRVFVRERAPHSQKRK